MNHEQFSSLAELYAIDALDSTELQSFRDHLSLGCAECEKIIRLTQEDLARAAFSLKTERLSPTVKAALMEKISAPVESVALSEPVSLMDRVRQWMPLAGLAVAACLLWLIPMPVNNAPVEIKQAAIHDKEMLNILNSSHTHKIALAGTSEDANASAELAWNTDACGGCLVIQNLRHLTPGQVYQLWATQDSKAPVSLGIFSVDENGKAHMDIKDKTAALQFQSFAVTREPAGGVVSPTGPVFLSGKF